jgi:FlaA1/EpsC-like NDP-sugar epimerase
MLPNMAILITGGTGSFGQHFVTTALERYPDVRRLAIYPRDELKRYEMAHCRLPESESPSMAAECADVVETPDRIGAAG